MTASVANGYPEGHRTANIGGSKAKQGAICGFMVLLRRKCEGLGSYVKGARKAILQE